MQQELPRRISKVSLTSIHSSIHPSIYFDSISRFIQFWRDLSLLIELKSFGSHNLVFIPKLIVEFLPLFFLKLTCSFSASFLGYRVSFWAELKSKELLEMWKKKNLINHVDPFWLILIYFDWNLWEPIIHIISAIVWKITAVCHVLIDKQTHS